MYMKLYRVAFLNIKLAKDLVKLSPSKIPPLLPFRGKIHPLRPRLFHYSTCSACFIKKPRRAIARANTYKILRPRQCSFIMRLHSPSAFFFRDKFNNVLTCTHHRHIRHIKQIKESVFQVIQFIRKLLK